jgi:hypothetical protein
MMDSYISREFSSDAMLVVWLSRCCEKKYGRGQRKGG